MCSQLFEDKLEQNTDHYDAFLQARAVAIRKCREGEIGAALQALASAGFHLEMGVITIPSDPELDRCLLMLAELLRKEIQPSPFRPPHDKPRIAHIVPYLLDGGGFTSVYLGFFSLNHYLSLDVKGYCTNMIDSCQEAPNAVFQIQKYSFPIEMFPREMSLLQRIQLLSQKLIEDKIDIAVIHGIPWDIVSIITGLLKPVPVCIYFHIATYSTNLGQYLLDYHLDTDPTIYRDCLLHNKTEQCLFQTSGVEFLVLEVLKAEPYPKEELGFKQDWFLIGTFSSIYKVLYNGSFVFLQTLKNILENAPQAHYVIGGPPDAFYDFNVIAREYLGAELAQRIHCLGNRTDVPRILKTLDLYINSFPLGGGCAIREAMAANLPVLTLRTRWDDQFMGWSDDVGIEEAIADSPEELAKKTIALIVNPQKREELRTSIFQRFLQVLDPRLSFYEYGQLFQKLWSSHNVVR